MAVNSSHSWPQVLQTGNTERTLRQGLISNATYSSLYLLPLVPVPHGKPVHPEKQNINSIQRFQMGKGRRGGGEEGRSGRTGSGGGQGVGGERE